VYSNVDYSRFVTDTRPTLV